MFGRDDYLDGVVRSATSFADYRGYRPANPKKSAKYKLGLDEKVKLTYPVGKDLKAILTIEDHPDLVLMVSAAKVAAGEQPAGVFYINEYGHVVVAAAGRKVFAGLYRVPLEFSLDGQAIGPRAPDGLEPGKPWPGPHVGIRYTVGTDGDVRYQRHVSADLVETVRLSNANANSPGMIERLRLARPGGGSLFLNEAMEAFYPKQDQEGWSPTYLGRIARSQWFSEPQAWG